MQCPLLIRRAGGLRGLRWERADGDLPLARRAARGSWHPRGIPTENDVRLTGPAVSFRSDYVGCPRRSPCRVAGARTIRRQRDAEHLVYHSPKPRRDGPSELVLTPLELIDKIATLVAPPRTHRHRYYDVLAINAPLRATVTALAPAVVIDPSPPTVWMLPIQRNRATALCRAICASCCWRASLNPSPR